MSTETVPVIDVRRLHTASTLKSIDAACREWGFFQVVGHGVRRRIADRLMTNSREFFALPSRQKRAISRTAANPWGFYDKELTKNTRDWKQIYDFGPADGGDMWPQWPAALPDFEPAVREYHQSCERLAFDLLGAVATNLGVAPAVLTQAFRPQHTSFLRLNYYPRCPRPERPDGIATPLHGHLGINHHTDAGALTLLLQDAQPGLEVFRDGTWHLVEPLRDALVINVGDIVQVWSNDRYKAALHRVIANADAERFSVPYFMSPAYAAQYAPLPTTFDGTDMSDLPHYRPINWGEFYRKRAAGDYADIGEEVQISHYRIA